MVSDFVEEHNGYLTQTEEEHQAAKVPYRPKGTPSFVRIWGRERWLLDECQVYGSGRECL